MPEDRESLSRDDFAHAVRDSVNETLSRYDHHPHHGYTPAAFRHYVRQIALLGTLESIPFASALDVGCAEGYFMKIIRDRFGVEVWGVDLSTTALAKAHELHGLSVGAAEATRLPFADGSFDLVYSTEVIEHVLDPDLMLAEMRRVSRGTVLVTTPVSQTADEHEPDFALQAEGHINNFDPASVRRLFGPEANLGSFRCNATLAMIVAVGRHLPAGARDAFYRLDHAVSQRWGTPAHRVKPLRNRDWLITVPGVGKGEGPPRWSCAACHGELEPAGELESAGELEPAGGLEAAGEPHRAGASEQAAESLRCASCGAVYAVVGGVPDFFPTAAPPSVL